MSVVRARPLLSGLTPRRRKFVGLLVGAIAIMATILGAIMGNVIRLGPSTVPLPDDALTIQAMWYRFPDSDPNHDYYAIVVTAVNGAAIPSVYPYAIEVNLTVLGGQALDHRPMAGDQRVPGEDALSWGGSPPDLHLNLPSGLVTPHEGAGYQEWTVAGRRGLESQPIFDSSADFYAEFALPENATLEGHPEVRLDWYYTNPLQAYPVAMRAGHLVCAYIPSAGSEGTAPYGACA